MKKKIMMTLALAAMMLAPMSVSAQSYGDVDGVTSATQQTNVQRPHRRHGQRLTVDSLNTYMKVNLALSSEQEVKVKALNEKYKDIIEGPKPPKGGQRPSGNGENGCPAGPPPQGKSNFSCCQGNDSTQHKNPFERMASRQQAYDNELKAILNDSQYADYEKIKTKFASQRIQRRGKKD